MKTFSGYRQNKEDWLQKFLLRKIFKSSKKKRPNRLKKVDAIVMNPPYLRQETIDIENDKDNIFGHLSEDDLAEVLQKDPELDIDKKSDIFCYFITHSWQFLKKNGRLGIIVFDRMLDTKYGDKFQKVLNRLFKIETIISIEKQAFDEPLIGSIILILEKEDEVDIRNANQVNFLRVKKKLTINEIIEILNSNGDIENDSFRLIRISQNILMNHSKWTNFLIHNFNLMSLLRSRLILKMEDEAILKYGKKSGENDFFFTKLNELPDNLRKYFKPLLKAIGQINKIQYDEENPEWGILELSSIMQPLITDNYEEKSSIS